MRIQFMILLITLCSFGTFAQSGWHLQNPLPQENNLFAVTSVDAHTKIAVGNGGTILRTTDGGASWVIVTSGTTNNLYGVSFMNAQNGIIVGANCTILRTTNGGLSWIDQSIRTEENPSSVGDPTNFYGVDFADANNGFIVGGYAPTGYVAVYRTIDGGITWTRKSVGGVHGNLYGISFADVNNGIIVGSANTILRTTDGGTSWTSQTSGTQIILSGVSITDANHATIVGGTYNSGIILHTTDGGIHWSKTFETSGSLRGVFFSDAIHGTAVGEFGTIFRTTDGGASWMSQTSETTNDLWGVSFSDVNTGTIVGIGGIILHTTTGGVVCSFTLSSSQANHNSEGGTGAVNVITPRSDCPWTAISNADWITITSGSSGSGNGTVNYAVSVNSSSGSRTGSMTIADNTFTVIQYDSTMTVINMSTGWNLVSVPRIQENNKAEVVFPGKYSAMSGYSKSSSDYVEAPTLEVGLGYWVYYTSATTISITGAAADPIKIACKAGWNLIGSRERTVRMSDLQLSAGSIFGSASYYNPSFGDYSGTTVIEPGRGVWIYLTEDCELTIP